jgi:beta-lactamase regulating signal transducer with metallopeptidase domain
MFSCQLVVSILTFVFVLDNFSHSGAGAISSFPFFDVHTSGIPGMGGDNMTATGLTGRLIGSIDSHTGMIVNCWVLVLALLFARMLAGMFYLKRLRRNNLMAVDEEWIDRLHKLTERMHLPIPVYLKESTLVNVPLVIGYLKPLILVPVGLLNGLPPDQVEAILCHELAHIRRNDFIVNIFQSVVEIIFFFNPFVWWISSLLREERENCCDDAAVRGIGEKKTIIEAFLSFHECRPMPIDYVHRFTGRDQKLILRVKRIFYNKNNAVAPSVQVIIMGCILVAGVMFSAFRNGNVPAARERRIGISINQYDHYLVRADTVPGGNELQRKLKEIDRKYAPLEAEHEDRVRETKRNIKTLQAESTGKEGVELRQITRKKDSLMVVADAMGGDVSLRKNEEVMRLVNPGMSTKHVDTAQRADGERSAREQEKKYTLKQLGEMDGAAPAGGVQKGYTIKQYSQMDQDGGGQKTHVNSPEELKKMELQRLENDSRSDAVFEGFLNDLLADHLIGSKDGASFYLSKEKFIVNDQLQPDAIRQKYLQNFRIRDHVALVYRFHSEMIGWMDN